MNSIIKAPKVGLSGKVLQWEVVNADGSIDKACYKPNDNVITDVGLDMLATSNGYSYNNHWVTTYFCIGTGTVEPSATDTKLTAETYRGTCVFSDSVTYSANGSDPYYIYQHRWAQTPLGALNGTYGEIGFSPSSTANANVFSKHILKDENGDPTTVIVSSEQQLRLHYVLTYLMSPSTTMTGTINIDGLGDVAYEAAWQWVTTSLSDIVKTMSCNYTLSMFASIQQNYSLLPIGQKQASYTSGGTGTEIISAYVNGSHERFVTGTWNVSQGNGTWYGVFLGAPYNNINQYPVFYIKFTTPIVKANTHAMSFTIKTSWGRS